MQLKYKENQEWKSILDLYNKEELPTDNALHLYKQGKWVDINKYPIQEVHSQPNESLLTFSLNDKTYNYSIGDLVMYNEITSASESIWRDFDNTSKVSRSGSTVF